MSWAMPPPTTRPPLVDAVALGQLAAQLAGLAVDVAVQAAPGGEGDRVDDRRGRELRPGRARQVDRVDARQLAAAALLRLGPQPAVDLLLAERLELAVAVEQPHQLVGEIVGPSPPTSSSQTVKPTAGDDRRRAEDDRQHARALVDPRGAAHEDPRLVDPLEEDEAAEQQAEQDAEPEEEPQPDVVREVLDLRGDPQGEQRRRSPEQQVDDHHHGEHGVGQQPVGAPAPGGAGVRDGAVVDRRRPRPAADEEAAGVGGVRAHPARIGCFGRLAAVQAVEQVGVLLVDDVALDLQRRRELAGLLGEVVVEDRELLTCSTWA